VLGTTGVAGSVTGGASYSAGVNLIQNGGFEPLTLAGWTTAGTVFAGIDGYNSNSEVGFFSPSDATFATLSQKITTVVGTTYSIDFFQIWGQNLIVSANGVTLGSFANYNGTWTEYTYQFVATSTNTNIMFATNYQATLDQISVRSTTTGTAGTETVTGAISFTDQDSADTHTVTVAPVTVGYVGNFAAAVSPDATGGITGKVNWTFTAQDSDLAFIAKGASVQQSYTVTVDDGHGGKSAQNVVVTLVGGNHAPTAIADASNVNEDATASVTTRATGVLGNDTDPDTGDAATLTVSAILAGTTGTPTALSGGLASIAGTYGTLVMHSDGTYSYTPNGANAEALALGQQAQDVFTYTAQDSSGRAATTTLTFNITGQNDAPAITSGTTTGITEQAVQLASTSPDTKSGSLGFTDVDVNDTHTASVLSVTAAGVTAGLPSNAVLLGYLTTGAITESHGATGAIAWTFSAQDRTFDYLGASQTATLTYTVQVADNHGGTATQTVAVTITGTNDAAVVTGTTTGSVTEAGGVVNGTAGVPTATGTLTDTDVDGAANTFQAVTAATGSALGYGTYTIDATGHWTYNLSNGNAAVQALNAGGQLTDTFSVATQDGTAQTITVTINGADDAPVNTVPVAQNATSNQNFVFSSAKGDAISVSDVDNTSLTETLTVSHGTLTLSGLSGLTFTTGDGTADATMTFSGTQSAINAALNGLIYAPATNYSGSDSLQIASYDGSLTTTNTVGITVSANHAPVLAAVHAGETLSKLSSQNIGSTANALVLDGHLGLGVNANIMLDTTIPHVSISATGSGTLDYYKFTVTAGARGIFDIDSGLDTVINLLDSNGNKIASDDDSLITDGAGGSPLSSGSSTAHDSFLDYTFAAGGTYYLAVGVYGGNATIPSAIGSGSAYQLQVSLSSVATGPSFDGYTAGAGAPSGAVGTKVSSLVDLPGNGGRDNVTDSDAGAVTGIALSGTDTSHGTWWYSLNGSDWFMVGAVDDTHALLLAADANTRLYFQPAAGFNGSVSNAITFHAWDTTSGSAGTKIDASVNGGATAISTATVAAGLGVLGSPTVSISQSHASNTGTYKYTFNEAVIGFDQSDITYGNNITLTGGLIHVGLDASGHDVYTQAFSYAGSSASSHAATVGTGYTDLAGNTGTGSTTNFPAGVSGEPINLALTTPSSGHVGAISLSVAGVPAGWTLSEGTHNADGSWSVQTGDIGSLSISSPEGYTGALVLQVTESWTDGNGVAHNVYVSDNVEAYAKGAPIFAWSGDDTLTASSGNDMLVFTDRIGNDVVHHFDTAHDQIDLIGFAGVSSFADVQAHLANDAAGNARITLGDGETITLTGVDAGSLTAADFVFDQTPMTHNAGTLAIGDGALLPISGIVDNRGDIHLGSAGQETDLELVQHGVTLQGGGTVTLSDNDGNLIFGSDADVTLTNVDNTISGAGQIGGGQMTLVNEGSIIADGSHALLIDTGDNAVINTGLMEAAGSGGLVVHGNLSNDGMLWANGGNITVDGDVSGGGSARISGTGSLDIGGAFDERIVFDDGAAGTLKLDHAADFGGILSGFDHNDVLDLAGILGASATLSYAENAQGTGGVLSVTDGSHTANIAFSGQYAASDFHVAADSGNHALVQLEHQLQQLTAAA
jgi:VCBS repeat-containing protein